MEISNDVKPGLVVVTGHLDDERISLPVATRVSHPQFDGVSDMRTPVQGDDTRAMVELLEDHHVSGRLNKLKGSLIKHAWYAAWKATQVWVDVLPLRQVRVVVIDLLPFRPRPRLVGNSAVRRVHNQTLMVGLVSAQQNVCLIRSLFDVVQSEPSPSVIPKSLNIRLAIRHSRRVPGPLRCRRRLAGAGYRHQRQDSDRACQGNR